ncbi:DUF3515 family protein [Myceligenerans xiligouense]|uniref:Uncharacterized protein DUF3515 n=1 Tax=Myceligenerans xiligouense TaxID=253184 RepID=A0A3N4YLZ1_9MICO|nr:DUF3515 family protein [Myceligenerans xiligouense]RPF20456.1 uncharacterized protein DUF3515 [Myceligenerans xiligouense]
MISRRRAPLVAALPAAAALVATTACAPTIGVAAAPDAADPECAAVVLALPDALDEDLPRVDTNSQATAAWGAPGAAVTLRCGVEPPGPSAQCQSVESANGTTVDWIVATDDEGTWSFTTYGRDPAVEVVVPPAVMEDHSSSFVIDFAGAVSAVEAERTCQ